MPIRYLLTISLVWVIFQVQGPAQIEGLKNPFYSFHNGLRNKSPAGLPKKAALLQELGYDGIEGYGLDELPTLAKEIRKQGLKVFTIYFSVNIDDAKKPYDLRIREHLQTYLKDTGIILTVHIHSKKFKNSDPSGDAIAVPILRRLADLAHENGAKVAIYNHVGFWAETLDDGIRLSKKVNRRNFGAAFNLCHWLRLNGEVDLQKTADRISPYLMSVTLCGADGGPSAKGAGWNKLVRPLDEGTFDNLSFLKAVVSRGYTGPIGLQCFNIRLPAKVHLSRSMKAWRNLKKRFKVGN